MDSSSLMAKNDDLSSSLVQEIAASLTDNRIPEKFMHKDACPKAEEVDVTGDLLLDFSRLSSKEELEKLRFALSTGRCFQVVNHGIETKFMEKVLEVSREFFTLPLEEKKKVHGPAGMYNGYGNDGVVWGNQTQNWNDGLYFKTNSEDLADLKFWPENPPELRKVVRELADKAKILPQIILKAIARSLDLEEDCFSKHNVLDGEDILKFNLYPPCPNPEKVLGFTPHSDSTVITILFQDQEGLQYHADGRWYKVPLIPGALMVVVGDLMEIMSNGAIKSTIHRVVTNPEKQRISVALFYNPSPLREIGPVDELISVDRPILYKKTNLMEFGLAYVELTPQGKIPLLAFKL